MTIARLFCCTFALAVAACATPGVAREPTLPTTSRYQLCSDPQFECTPASATMAPAAELPIRVDTNFASPRRSPARG